MENDSKTFKTENKCDESRKDNSSYWKRMMRGYEKRNASLERRRAALIERVHFMECALPSLLMSAAVVSTNRSEQQSPKVSCHDGTSDRYLIITDRHVKRKSKDTQRYE
ncbi:uncharacterized protein LOC124949941 isoform X1 [Vespa velutina]|uniref:uncharacterized protein LOC124949941 isoform X1 n=1 Tax=Vespa velutina TaxID=202808 RepID=UPI001FB3D8A5|nr:uncharacterized protein LOC124949941 isoform X1 [Vespa velutina]